MDRYLRGNKGKGAAAAALAGISVLLLLLSKGFPGFAQWYSVHIYPIWVGSVGRAAGVFPCSLSEVFLYVLAGYIVAVAAMGIRCVVRREPGKGAGGRLFSVILLAGVLFFLYTLNCGINYHRTSFSESSGILVRQYSKEELREVCLWLTDEVNGLSGKVARDENGVMEVSPDADDEAVQAMHSLGGVYTEISGYYPPPKGLIFPWILSVQSLTGVYSPFTVEANYNTGMPDYNIPFTMCHELSHLRGFMQEEEANFIAFLACRASDKMEFLYSGNLMGWIYCMNVLYKADYKAWEEVREELSPEVEADLRTNREFWARYDGAVTEVANRVNDTYLKANGQQDGVKSYDRMVDLIVAYYGQE